MASQAVIHGSQERTTRLAFVFLLCGATCIGMAPILVRISELNALPTAFLPIVFGFTVAVAMDRDIR